MAAENKRFTSVKLVPEILPCLSVSSVRWLIHQNAEFRRRCVFRLGRKILIGIPELIKFIEDQKITEIDS